MKSIGIAKVFISPSIRSRGSFGSFYSSRCFYKTLASREIHFFSSMAEVGNMSGVSAADEEQYGFKRQEMYSTNLSGSVSPYARHVFLCYKGPDTWLPRVESEGLPQRFASSFKARKADISVQTMITICGGGESDGDVLIFPEMIRYKGLTESDVDAFVEDVLVKGQPWASGIKEALTGSYVFVCAHGSRDKRCGVCGPALIETFKQETRSRELSDRVFIEPCSHVGGHKYAGNLIIFSPDQAGKVSGHWYGYVTPDDVPALLDQHIAKGEIIQRIWRGEMGAAPGDGLKLPNGNRVTKRRRVEKKGVTEGGGCCQGTRGVSCCREDNAETVEKKGDCKPSSWFRSLEKDEIFMAAAVVGAVAMVAAGAYSFYRRSG